MNGVLVKNKTISSLWQIGPWNLLGYYNPLHMEDYLYDFFDLCKPRAEDAPQAEHKGRLLPQLLCDWLLGNSTNQELLECVNTTMQENPEFFKQNCPKKVITGITQYMFTPERFIKSIKLHPKGYSLFKKCRKMAYHSGKPVHRIFIVTNWDRESFALLRNKHEIGDMINSADGVVVSGDVHMIKPDPAIFEYLFATYNIDPDTETTVYIDDEFINIRAADSLGKKHLYPLHCYSFTEIKRQLRLLNIIP